MKYFYFFTQKLRLGNPWNYKAPLLIAVPYFMILSGNLTSYEAFKNIVLAITTIIGIAGIGYLTNDLSDREKDAAIGKSNATTDLNKIEITGLFGVFTALALIPWLYFPMTIISYSLLAAQFLLFILYAFPPFRLKEKGVLGVMADTLYAHVLPAILAAYTFYLITGADSTYFKWFCLFIGTWQFFLGIRNILFHQVEDVENDQNSDTQTWVTQAGKEKAEKYLRYLILPLEVVSFLAFATFINFNIIYFLPVFALFIAWQFMNRKKLAPTWDYRNKAYLLLDQFYIQWVPVLVLIAIIFIPTEVTPILLLHLVLFRNFLKSFFLKLVKLLPVRLKWVFTFSSYYKGLLIHVGLLLIYLFIFIGIYYLLPLYTSHQGYLNWLQLTLSRILVITIIIHLGILIRYRWEAFKDMMQGYFFSKGSAYNLAIFRVLFAHWIIFKFPVWRSQELIHWSELPASARVDLPFIGWIIQNIPISPEIYYNMAILGVVCGFMLLFGLFTRWAAMILIPVAFYIWGVPCFYGKLNHNQIMVWVPMILVFSKSGDVWSFDYLINRFIRKKTLGDPLKVAYALPFKFLWMLLGIIYCFSGFYKLWDAGLDWALSDNAVNQMRWEWVEHYDLVPNFRLDLYPVLAKVGALSVIIAEILYPLFIFKPNTRIFTLIGAYALHLSAGYFMYIDFVMLRKLHFSYINWHRIYLRMLLFFKKIKTTDYTTFYFEHLQPAKINFQPLKPLLMVGFFLLVINSSFSFFGIHTWPFSSYPTYSGIAKSEISIIRMEATTANGESVDVKKLGKDQNFRWENIRPFEQRIVDLVEQGDTSNLQNKINDYWVLWVSKVDGLDRITRVDMFLETSSIVPEERDQVIRSVYLGRVNPHTNKEL